MLMSVGPQGADLAPAVVSTLLGAFVAGLPGGALLPVILILLGRRPLWLYAVFGMVYAPLIVFAVARVVLGHVEAMTVLRNLAVGGGILFAGIAGAAWWGVERCIGRPGPPRFPKEGQP
jgi:hypothetical protein